MSDRKNTSVPVSHSFINENIILDQVSSFSRFFLEPKTSINSWFSVLARMKPSLRLNPYTASDAAVVLKEKCISAILLHHSNVLY